MRRLGRDVPPVAAALLASLMLWSAATLAQSTPETFAATATVKRGGASVSAPVSLTITRYSSDDERDAVMAAVRAGGSHALHRALGSAKDAGHIQLGDRRTAIKFVGQRPMPSGRLLTIVTAEPILFLGAGLPDAPPRDGFEVAVAMLEVDGEKLSGELVPAAKVGVDPKGALLIDDYGATVVWLSGGASKH
jgi:hypothetical protein